MSSLPPAASAPAAVPTTSTSFSSWNLRLPTAWLGAAVFVPINMYCLAKMDTMESSVRDLTKTALTTFSSVLLIASVIRIPRIFSFKKLTCKSEVDDARADAEADAAYDAFAQTRVGYCVDLLNELFEVTFLPALLGTFTPVAIRTWQDMAQNKYAFGSISNVHLYVLSVGVGLWFDTLGVAYDCLFGQEESEESE